MRAIHAADAHALRRDESRHAGRRSRDIACNTLTCSFTRKGLLPLFGGGIGSEAEPAVDLKVLHAKIGELTLENDFLAGALGKAGLLSAKR